LSTNGVEAALLVHGRVVETVALADLVCLQAVVARCDGELALLLYQAQNFATLAGFVAPLIGRVRLRVTACTADKARCRKSDQATGAAPTSAPNPTKARHKRTIQHTRVLNAGHPRLASGPLLGMSLARGRGVALRLLGL
jgi:hypothetical protein